MAALAPLTDITNLRRVQSNIPIGCQPLSISPLLSRASLESIALSLEAISPLSLTHNLGRSPSLVASQQQTYRHDPYNWKCLPGSDQQATMLLAQRASHFAATQRQRKSVLHMQTCGIQRQPLPESMPEVATQPAVSNTPTAVPTSGSTASCRILVQFKCHHGEFSSSVTVEKGQYVVVQGDRGMDIGVVIRVNTDCQKTYIERTGPCGSVLRHATQREVDYWASELKADEQAALDFCRRRVLANDLIMEVRHAEYQFDKKKLTFYYDAKSRVDFVTLLKELYREFGCRIWMEKVRSTE